MKDNKKKTTDKEAEEKQKAELLKQSDLLSIFENTESLVKPKDKKKESEIVQLISGEVAVISDKIERYDSQYPMEMYEHLYRVYKLKGDPKAWKKDKKCADFTNEMFYAGRFGKGVLQTLREKNKYDSSKGYCERARKHYYHLNSTGIHMLQKFISQTVDALKLCTEEYEFRKYMFALYKVPYQQDMFRD